MLTTSSRLLRLISLLQTRRYWTGEELSERLDVDRRTLRRDVERLRQLGYPIHASSGVGGGYQLGAGAELPPVLFDDDEAVTVAVALRAATGSIGGLEETALRLLAKLDQLMPARLRQRASALHAVTLTLPMETALADADLLAGIAAACRDQQGLQFDYRSHDGNPTRRRTEPLRLANLGRRWYLVAYDTDRADWRTFRIDRIAAPLQAGPRFTPRPPPGDVAAYVMRSVNQAPFRHRLQLKLKGSLDTLAPQIPFWCGVLEGLDAQHCLLTISADNASYLLANVVSLGMEFEIVDDGGQSPELRAALQRLQRGLTPPPTADAAAASPSAAR